MLSIHCSNYQTINRTRAFAHRWAKQGKSEFFNNIPLKNAFMVTEVIIKIKGHYIFHKTGAIHFSCIWSPSTTNGGQNIEK